MKPEEKPRIIERNNQIFIAFNTEKNTSGTVPKNAQVLKAIRPQLADPLSIFGDSDNGNLSEFETDKQNVIKCKIHMTEVLLHYLSEGFIGKINWNPGTFMRTFLSLYKISLENPLVKSYLHKNTEIEFIANAVQTTTEGVLKKLIEGVPLLEKEKTICEHLKALTKKKCTLSTVSDEIRAHFGSGNNKTTSSPAPQFLKI